MLKLRRLKIEKFRNLARGTELSFSDGINIVLGQNGTGKTTLLELISMVVRSDFGTLATEELAVEYELSAGERESIIVVVRNERTTATAQIEYGAPEDLRSSAMVLAGTDRRLLGRIDPERGLHVDGGLTGTSLRPDAALAPPFLKMLILSAAGVAGNGEITVMPSANAHRLDESLDLFRRATSAAEPLGTALRLKRDDTREWTLSPVDWALIPEVLLKKLDSAYELKKSDYAFAPNDLSLAPIESMMGFDSSELRVGVTARSRTQDGTEIIQLGNLLFRFWWPDGTFTTHDKLSYGQKRLLTFFYYLACNPDIVIADELVNGLHHRWITASIEALGQRQAFLTSQNPLLLDYVPITSAEEARRSFVLCRGEPMKGRLAWIWENMSEADAEELYRAYEIGIEHVSEILQSRGLW